MEQHYQNYSIFILNVEPGIFAYSTSNLQCEQAHERD